MSDGSLNRSGARNVLHRTCCSHRAGMPSAVMHVFTGAIHS